MGGICRIFLTDHWHTVTVMVLGIGKSFANAMLFQHGLGVYLDNSTYFFEITCCMSGNLFLVSKFQFTYLQPPECRHSCKHTWTPDRPVSRNLRLPFAISKSALHLQRSCASILLHPMSFRSFFPLMDRDARAGMVSQSMQLLVQMPMPERDEIKIKQILLRWPGLL